MFVKIVSVAKYQTCMLQKSAHSKFAIFLVSPNNCLVHTYIHRNSLSLLFCPRSSACARDAVDLRRFLVFKKEKSEICFLESMGGDAEYLFPHRIFQVEGWGCIPMGILIAPPLTCGHPQDILQGSLGAGLYPAWKLFPFGHLESNTP